MTTMMVMIIEMISLVTIQCVNSYICNKYYNRYKMLMIMTMMTLFVDALVNVFTLKFGGWGLNSDSNGGEAGGCG